MCCRYLHARDCRDGKSVRQQHAFAQEIETATAIYLAFDEFQAVDVAFDWTGAPVDGEARVHRPPIAMKIAAEAAQLRWTGALDFGYPAFELGPTSLADQHHKLLRQSPARGQLAGAATEIREKHAFRIVELGPASQEQPAQRLRTRQDAANWRRWCCCAPSLNETSDRSLAATIPEWPEFVMQERRDGCDRKLYGRGTTGWGAAPGRVGASHEVTRLC
jgi:hypothetical protein